MASGTNRAAVAKYRITEKGKLAADKYRATEKGKLTARAAVAKYRATEKGKTTGRIGRKRHYDARRAWLNALKSHPCVDCGGMFPPECMDFDHIRGDKKFIVAHGVLSTEEDLLEEIEKCDLVCSNCHRIRTARRRITK